MEREHEKSGSWENTDYADDLGVGILLVDSSVSLVYGNQEAIELLAYPDNPPDTAWHDQLVPRKIASRLRMGQYGSAEYLSGRRRYRYQAFPVRTNKTNSGDGIAVIFARRPVAPMNLARVVDQFHLTVREAETVRFLLKGLASKEIATRMGISPHTVKAFIKLVMIKMNASSRGEIIAKTLTSLGLS